MKLTPDGHTNTGFQISRENPNLVNSRHEYEVRDRRSRWHPNHSRREHEEEMRVFTVVYTRRTHTEVIWRLHNVVLRVRCVRTRSRRCHVTSRWYKTFGRPWEIQQMIGDLWEQKVQCISTLF